MTSYPQKNFITVIQKLLCEPCTDNVGDDDDMMISFIMQITLKLNWLSSEIQKPSLNDYILISVAVNITLIS